MELRPVTQEELPQFVRADGIGFGIISTDEHITDAEHVLELDRTVAVFDGDEIVGTAAAFTFELTLPGLSTLPAAGVTWVSVLPTHRRQGVLRRIMAFQLDDVAARDEPLAVLTASEGGIYDRFGYGAATFTYDLEVDPARVKWRDVLPDAGRVRLIDAEAARKVFPPVFDLVRRGRPGDHQRTDAVWDHWFQDKEKWRNGMSARFYVVHESATGEVDGFVAYRRTTGWDQFGNPNGSALVEDVFATEPAAYAALWRHVLSLDLVATVKAPDRPADEPVRWLVANARSIRVSSYGDDLWVRILDVERALSARSYAADGRLVFDVEDGFRPQTAGRYVLDGGRCVRDAAAVPDFELDIAMLGSVYLGGVTFTELVAAGRITEFTPGAAARADAMFRSTPLPSSQTGF